MLYAQFKKLDLIEKEEYTKTPRRCRGKFSGYMWEAEKKVTLKDRRKFIFYMWHHYSNDPGNDWEPMGRELDNAFAVKFIKIDGCFCDVYQHLIYNEQKVYGTKKSMDEGYRSVAKQKILDGSWETDDDIFLVL